MKWIGASGIGKHHGVDTVDVLGREMARRGHPWYDFDYPYRNFITGRIRKYQFDDAWKLMDESEDGDSFVGHSRAGLVGFRACQAGRRWRDMWLISPAMPKDWRFPKNCAENIFVVYNPRDRAIWLTRLLFWGDFGTMGSEGSTDIFDHPEKGENIMRVYEGKNRHFFLPQRVSEYADLLENRGPVEVGGA